MLRPMPRKPKPKPDDPKQYKRFLEAAKELGADQDPKAFERKFKKLVPRAKPKSPAPT